MGEHWMVHKQGSYCTIEHSNIYDAENEACRLAKANPGTHFYVLHSISSFCTKQPEVVKTEIEDKL